MQAKIAATLLNEPAGPHYQRIDFFAKRSVSMSLVIRDSLNPGESMRRVIYQLEPFVISSKITAEWAGTVLYERRALLNTMRVCDGSIEVVRRATNRLYGWREPALPEDLTFFGSDGEPILVSISHELDAFVKLAPADFGQFLSCIPLNELAIEDT